MYRELSINDGYLLLVSTGWTVYISFLGFFFGGLLGFVIAVMRTANNIVPRTIAWAYIQLMQAVPLLILLLLFYYGLSAVGFRVGRVESAGVALALFTAAFLGEIWRGSIQSVPKAQWQAAEALGLGATARMLYVILPQALRISLPPTVGFLVQLIKGTSLVSVLGIVELTRAGQMINNATFKPFLVFGLVGALYFCICFPLSKFSRYLERKLNVGRRAVQGM
jgi:polar amino acid transport system permease protein